MSRQADDGSFLRCFAVKGTANKNPGLGVST